MNAPHTVCSFDLTTSCLQVERSLTHPENCYELLAALTVHVCLMIISFAISEKDIYNLKHRNKRRLYKEV